jgi:hypothetical protein
VTFMVQHDILWRKIFGIKPNDEFIDYIVISHRDGSFYGAVVYWEQNKSRKNKSIDPAVKLVTKYFVDLTETGILDQFSDWLLITFPGVKYEVFVK